ncbi:serine hydrolase domain-containing protein [Cohnella sp. GCM10020058]|uniref:serine hydrolase domain-containing protein n=1 Tax=Cohnella sp. GCM10020058 TaxID=3317330 RepID=UPI0036253F90
MIHACPEPIQAYLDRLLEENIASGYALAFSWQGQGYETAGGAVLTSSDGLIHIQPNTPFNVGSVTKIVTAALAVKLAERGRLSLADPVAKHVPAYRYDHSILQLMLHTAGFLPPEGLDWPKPEGMAAFRERIYAHQAAEEADRIATYYTQGYVVLMDVLEAASGMRLAQLARWELFEPLGMNDSAFDTQAWTPGTYTLPYDADNGGPLTALEGLAVTGDSGLYSTAPDLLRFGRMLLDGGRHEGRQVFSGAAAGLLMREVTNGRFYKTPAMWMRGPADGYGCFGDLLSPAAVGHTAFSGCMLVADPGTGFAGALVTNSQKLHADWSNYRKLWNVALAHLTGL